VPEPQKKGVFQKALDKMLGLASTVDIPKRDVNYKARFHGPKSGKEIMSLERKRPGKVSTPPKGRFLTEQQVKDNRWEQFKSVFGKKNPDLPHMAGIQRAIIPDTFGTTAYASPSGGPSGFQDPIRDKGGYAIPGTEQTYISPATHTGATQFDTIEKDDAEFGTYTYNRDRGMIPQEMSWAEYARQRKSGKLNP